MIIQHKKLTDFNSGHSREAEIGVMNAVCSLYDLKPGEVSTGNIPEFDFIINRTKIELKISKNGTTGLMELAKADGRASGLSITQSKLYAFLNPTGNGFAKLRIIRTSELQKYYSEFDSSRLIITQTYGDKIGSVLAPFDIRTFNDLYIAECKCEVTKNGLEFNTDTFKRNEYAKNNIGYYIK